MCQLHLTQTNGGITYVDVAFSLANHFKFAAVKNKAGVFAAAGLDARSRLQPATIIRVAPDNGGISIVNPAKSQPLAYPICTFTYVIVPNQTAKASGAEAVHPLGPDQGAGGRAEAALLIRFPKVVLNASLKTLTLVHT